MKDIYKEITDKMVAALENGVNPWKRPWNTADGSGNGLAYSHATGKPYSLLNQFLLGGAGEYITFAQCKKEGGKIRKGAKAQTVVFWKMLQKPRKEANGEPMLINGEEVIETVPYLHYSNVFNVQDCEGLKTVAGEAPIPEPERETNAVERIERADAVAKAYCQKEEIKLVEKPSNTAYYAPSADMVVVPSAAQFGNISEFYSTLYHELTHSTGHPNRLRRFEVGAHESKGVYGREELVAEMGAAYALGRLGINDEDTESNSAAYLASWAAAIKKDSRMVVWAAGRAEKAVSLIFGD